MLLMPGHSCDLGHAQTLSYLEGLPKVNLVQSNVWSEALGRVLAGEGL